MSAASTTTPEVVPADPVDPRPRVRLGDPVELLGTRCTACGYPTTEPLRRCPDCSAPMVETSFGARGVVFAATVLRVPVPGREPPYGLVYVDMVDGPRILAHTDRTDAPLVPGSFVDLVGVTDQHDPLVRPVEDPS